MSLIVEKYGGTSVGSIERINAVAEKVSKSHREGNQMVIVVSAMSGETNRLLDMAREINSGMPAREADVLVSTGEQVTIALLCMALMRIGHKAKSYTGGQVRIETDGSTAGHVSTTSTIAESGMTSIMVRLLSLRVSRVSIMKGNITTLGRGGSDTSAVALAAALKADECRIYTDVDGVYTADPRIVPEARRMDMVTFEEMLELSSQGAKVLQIDRLSLLENIKYPFVF